MKNILYIIVTLVLITACSKSEIDTWNIRSRVWFQKANDTIFSSFYAQPEGTTEYVVEIPISMAGPIFETDREVTVRILESVNSRCDILSAVVPAGEITGVLQVKVYRTDYLETANDTISFEICASEVFEVGLVDYLNNTLILSTKLSRPSWWDDYYAAYYIGFYSELKLGIIYNVFGTDQVFKEGSWGSDDRTIAIYKLNQYCKNNKIYYPGTDDIVKFGYRTN
ncbi:DUF4843 domain-containing protein [Butyricimonas paravirosa]|uniref:DUF4843 domain-containing protein n=1 Tax=Butyricimonas paravirosa TaxID=1472417 RepID=UPI00210E3E94|nr:DUF4843 domain-containing protein [Butyricimonas paravirosa]MCQ4872313.1 DUF4843 domain-containing protein [Butyricimonas paravirosa]